MSSANKRLLKEMKELLKEKDLSVVSDPASLSEIRVRLHVPNTAPHSADTPVVLAFTPTKTYPFTPPIVTFVGPAVPVHPHVYSNGHICLNILYDAWTPVQTIASVSLSVQSMLAGNTVHERPPDDETYCKHAPSNPLLSKWNFHDDTV